VAGKVCWNSVTAETLVIMTIVSIIAIAYRFLNANLSLGLLALSNFCNGRLNATAVPMSARVAFARISISEASIQISLSVWLQSMWIRAYRS